MFRPPGHNVSRYWVNDSFAAELEALLRALSTAKAPPGCWRKRSLKRAIESSRRAEPVAIQRRDYSF